MPHGTFSISVSCDRINIQQQLSKISDSIKEELTALVGDSDFQPDIKELKEDTNHNRTKLEICCEVWSSDQFDSFSEGMGQVTNTLKDALSENILPKHNCESCEFEVEVECDPDEDYDDGDEPA
jgi:hypothetical protein